MDPIVAAGGECYDSWCRVSPEGSLDRQHVHAKRMSADGRVCAVGSPNLEVTAGHWEGELLLVVEEDAIARSVEARFDELLAGSRRVERPTLRGRNRAQHCEWTVRTHRSACAIGRASSPANHRVRSSRPGVATP